MTTGPFTILNLPFPIVSQHDPPSSDVENELCGEACAAAIIGYYWGTDYMPTAANVWDSLGIPAGTPSSLTELAKYLAGRGIGSSNKGPALSLDALTYIIWKYTVAGRPVLIVQNYSGSVQTAHWRVVIGMTETTVWLMEPWNGSIVKQSYSDLWNLYLNAGTNKALLAIEGKV